MIIVQLILGIVVVGFSDLLLVISVLIVVDGGRHVDHCSTMLRLKCDFTCETQKWPKKMVFWGLYIKKI